MMKQLFTSLAVTAAFFVNAQTVSPDPSFGNGGIYVGNPTIGFSFIQNTPLSDGKILMSGQYLDFSNQPISFISRLNNNGTLDTTFGTNGYFTGIQYQYEYYIKTYETNGKIIAVYSDEGKIVRLNANGTIDTTFGTNGVISFEDYEISREGNFIEGNYLYFVRESNLWGTKELVKLDLTTGNELFANSLSSGYDNDALINLPNGNMMMMYRDDTNLKRYVSIYSKDGNIVPSLGINGVLEIANYPSNNDYENSYVFIASDSQSNVYFVTSNENTNTSTVKKLLNNGTVDGSFGTNGTFTAAQFSYGSVKVFGDKLYLGGARMNNLTDVDLLLQRLNSNGTPDTTFTSTGYYIFDTNATEEWAESLSILSPTSILAVGEIMGSPNKIYASKFLMSASLGTTDLIKKNGIVFENPVRATLSYKSGEKVSKVELYGMDGRLVRSIAANGASVADLPKGVYVAKVFFQNGTSTTTKLIKQ